MSDKIETLAALEAIYGTPSPNSLKKVAKGLTPNYRRWIEASNFCVLTTVGPEGTDGSPRGDDGPVVRVIDANTLAMPDWRGNNRVDSLRNIVQDGRVSLMFMVPKTSNIVRVNGRAWLSTDPEMLTSFEFKSRHPRSVIMIEIGEVYFQCAKAVMRSGIWNADDKSDQIPSAGDFLKEMTDGAAGGDEYDAGYFDHAQKTMW